MRRRSPSPSTHTLGAALLCVAIAAACGPDVGTQPNENASRAPHFDIGTGDTTATTTTLVTVDSLIAPTLLVCPTTDAASARGVIGPAGGSLTARGTTITIPAGAVPDSTLFEVVVPASTFMEADIHAVGVDHYVFQSPVTITINYARCPASALPASGALEGVYVDTSTLQILQQMGGTNDKSGHKVSFPTWHLSGYIVAY